MSTVRRSIEVVRKKHLLSSLSDVIALRGQMCSCKRKLVRSLSVNSQNTDRIAKLRASYGVKPGYNAPSGTLLLKKPYDNEEISSRCTEDTEEVKEVRNTTVDSDIKAWEESGYIDYMSHQREKGWKT